jgi:hypothetical protein
MQKDNIYFFLSSSWYFIKKKTYILGHKASLNKYTTIEITLSILSDHNAVNLEVINKINSIKYSKNLLMEEHITS